MDVFAKLSAQINPTHEVICGLLFFPFHPLHTNIRMHILNTVLYTFPMALTRENLFNNQELVYLVIIFFLLMALKDPSQPPPFSMPSKLLILYGEAKSYCLL